MSHKTFTGTLSLGATDYAVTALLTHRGLRILGTVSFDIDETKIIPLNVITSGSITFYGSTGFSFTDPLDQLIEVAALTTPDTSTDTSFTTLSITDAPIEIDTVASTLSLTLDVEVVAIVEGVENEAEELSVRPRTSLQPIRIGEVGNQFDHAGGILSITRLDNEKNIDYLRRIRSVIAKPSNSTYQGLINGINRELGLSTSKAINIKMKDPTADQSLKIRLVLDQNVITIYEDWSPIQYQQAGVVLVVEQETTLGEMSVGKLVDWINESEYFEAKALGDTSAKAKFLVNGDSRKLVTTKLPAQQIMKLPDANIIPGTLTFPPIEELKTQIALDLTPAYKGEYKLNFLTGSITTYTQPSKKIEVTYFTNQIDFDIWLSPVKIIDITSEDGQNLLFDQIEREFYTSELDHYVNGLPTNEGWDALRKTLTASKFNQFWGE